MDISNLQINNHTLIDYLTNNGYSKSYIQHVRYAIRGTLLYGSQYDSYEELYFFILKQKSHTAKRTVKSLGQILALVQRFDLYGELPSRSVHHPFITKKDEKPCLPEEFDFLISNYRDNAANYLGHTRERIVSVVNNGIKFFLHLQTKGVSTLHDTSVADVASFFYDGVKQVRGKQHKMQIRAIMRCVRSDLREEAFDFMDKLPYIPRKMSNYDYLKKDEADKIAHAIIDEDNDLSLLDKALVAISFIYGMRSTDITALTMDNIDFENDTIHLIQSKTKASLDLPLSPVVGNIIYEYITKERPQSVENTIFVHGKSPQNSFGRIWYHIKCVCNVAGVRTEHGQIGVRLFRHHLATFLLSKNVSQPIISSILGHLMPQSINHYIDCDTEHLREFGLDISQYPVNEKIFDLWKK